MKKLTAPRILEDVCSSYVEYGFDIQTSYSEFVLTARQVMDLDVAPEYWSLPVTWHHVITKDV